mmetsp:Transcript_96418/g.267879  ORF Transcript_96418/g.267879 Transcript_96418/m.267879 type:complete len:251 (+) Transcript_96418:396-1148(+)
MLADLLVSGLAVRTEEQGDVRVALVRSLRCLLTGIVRGHIEALGLQVLLPRFGMVFEEIVHVVLVVHEEDLAPAWIVHVAVQLILVVLVYDTAAFGVLCGALPDDSIDPRQVSHGPGVFPEAYEPIVDRLLHNNARDVLAKEPHHAIPTTLTKNPDFAQWRRVRQDCVGVLRHQFDCRFCVGQLISTESTDSSWRRRLTRLTETAVIECENVEAPLPHDLRMDHLRLVCSIWAMPMNLNDCRCLVWGTNS